MSISGWSRTPNKRGWEPNTRDSKEERGMGVGCEDQVGRKKHGKEGEGHGVTAQGDKRSGERSKRGTRD